MQLNKNPSLYLSLVSDLAKIGSHVYNYKRAKAPANQNAMTNVITLTVDLC